MKVAFHFLGTHPELGTLPGREATRKVLTATRREPVLDLRTKVFLGNLLLTQLAYEREDTPDGSVGQFNKEMYEAIFQEWAYSENVIWKRMTDEAIAQCFDNVVYVVCLESVDKDHANTICARLVSDKSFLGALEVDDSSSVHWGAYSLIPSYRLVGNDAHVFWDGINEDLKDISEIEFLRKIGYRSVRFESLNARYTIFDAYHNFQHARRVAIWKRRCGSLLAFVADDVVSQIGDAAPGLGDKLYAAIKALDNAETSEELSHVMTSCRRVFEYVTDCIFPPLENEGGGEHKLGRKQYRNRLLAYADEQHRSKTNIDLVLTSKDLWAKQIEKLNELASKGVHDEVIRSEARRCLLRTIMLLDDIVSLRDRPFDVRTKFDKDQLLKMLRNP